MVEIRELDVKVNGRRMSFLEAGDGNRDLLLLHGWPIPKKGFNLAIPPLAEQGWHTISPDLPGFGLSEQLDESHNYSSLAQSMIGLMNYFEIDRATVGGLSMGAAVALVMARDYPNRINKLILNSPPVHHWDEMTASQRLMLKATERIPNLKELFHSGSMRRPDFFCWLLWGEHVDINDPNIKPVWEEMKHSSIRAPWEMLREFTYKDLRPELKRIQTPTHVFVGTNDNQFLNSSRTVAAQVRNGQLKYIEETDHWMAHKKPKSFAQQFAD